MINKDLIKLLIAEYQKPSFDIQLVRRDYEIDENLNYAFVGLSGQVLFNVSTEMKGLWQLTIRMNVRNMMIIIMKDEEQTINENGVILK